MRVLVYGLVGTNLGGIETFLLNMNEAMSDNCIFDFIIEEKECMHEERIKHRGGRVYRITSRSEDVFKHIKDIRQLYREHRDEYKTVYFNLSSASWIVPELIAKHMGYRVVIHSHNAMLIDVNSNVFYKVINAIDRQILRHIDIKRLACSDFAAKFLFGNGKYTLIYNGINVEKYRFSQNVRNEIRKKYDIEDDAFVVGVVGRLEYQKNPLFSIEIFREVFKGKLNSYMFMIGEGKLRSEIQDKIREYGLSENVILTGNVLNVQEYLNAFDAFLLPSRHEGLGIALIEAQANGLPCLTSEGVVPLEAKVTDLLEFFTLDKCASEWADILVGMKKNTNRNQSCDLLKTSHYSIQNEADRLERILLQT